MSEYKSSGASYENQGFEDFPVPIIPPAYQKNTKADIPVIQFEDPCPGQNKTDHESTQHIAYNMQSIPIAGMKMADADEIYSKVNRPPSTRPPVNNNVRSITGKLC